MKCEGFIGEGSDIKPCNYDGFTYCDTCGLCLSCCECPKDN